MAKLNALQALNTVLTNIGEAEVSSLVALTTFQKKCFDYLNESIDEIYSDQNNRWQFLESLGVVPMTTGSYQYQITALTSGSDMMREDKESFRQSDSGYTIKFLTPQEFDAEYPKGITTAVTGYPNKYTKYGGYLIFNAQATATQNGKNINFRYWKYATRYSTATATGTTDIPEPFDVTVITHLATLKILEFLGNTDYEIYKKYLYGDGREIQGSIDKLKELYSSPDLEPRMTYVF